MRKFSWVAVLASAVLLSGCFGDKDVLEIETLNEEPADKLYDDGLAYLNTGNLKEARKRFEEVEKQHPYSVEAQKSLVLSAFTAYRRGKYADTIADARRYLELYPATDDAPYMYYLTGQSYYRQLKDVTLDQRSTRASLAAYSELVRLYPESEYSEDAKRKIIILGDQLGGKEMQVGRYYQEREQHIAAVNRFKTVVNQHQTTRHIEEALYRLTESYLALGVVNEAQTAASVLGFNYPDSKWYKDAYSLLQTGGLEPRENRRSWISKAFRRDKGTTT